MNLKNTLPFDHVPWSVSDAAKGILIVLVANILVASLIAPVVLRFGPDIGVVRLLVSVALQGAVFVAVWLFGPWKYGKSWLALGLGPGVRKAIPRGVATFLAIFGLSIVYTSVVSAVGLDILDPPGLPREINENLVSEVVGFGLVVGLAPVTEELFFRGFLLPAFAAQLGFFKGAGLVSLLFALGHLSVGLFVPAFVSGMVLAYAYRATGSLWTSWVAHAMQNSVAFAAVVTVP